MKNTSCCVHILFSLCAMGIWLLVNVLFFSWTQTARVIMMS